MFVVIIILIFIGFFFFLILIFSNILVDEYFRLQKCMLRGPVHPSNTFLIMLLSVLSPCTLLWLTMHFDEHRYWSSGIRYFPQKSTNFICSTRSSKNTPAIKRKKRKCRYPKDFRFLSANRSVRFYSWKTHVQETKENFWYNNCFYLVAAVRSRNYYFNFFFFFFLINLFFLII